MADNYQMLTIQPSIPKSLFTEKELDILVTFGINWEGPDEDLYFFSEEYSASGYEDVEEGDKTETIDYDEDKVIEIFQNAIKRSEGKIDHVYLMGACTCSKMRPDEFGGWLLWITADSSEFWSTWERLRELQAAGDQKVAGMVAETKA